LFEDQTILDECYKQTLGAYSKKAPNILGRELQRLDSAERVCGRD